MAYESKIVFIDRENPKVRRNLRIGALLVSILLLTAALISIQNSDAIISYNSQSRSIENPGVFISIAGILLLFYAIFGKSLSGECYVKFSNRSLSWSLVDDSEYVPKIIRVRHRLKYYVGGEIGYEEITEIEIDSNVVKIKYKGGIFEIYRVDAGEIGYLDLMNETKKLKEYLQL